MVAVRGSIGRSETSYPSRSRRLTSRRDGSPRRLYSESTRVLGVDRRRQARDHLVMACRECRHQRYPRWTHSRILSSGSAGLVGREVAGRDDMGTGLATGAPTGAPLDLRPLIGSDGAGMALGTSASVTACCSSSPI